MVKVPPAASTAVPTPAKISPLPGRRDLWPEPGRRQLVQPLVPGVAVIPVEPPLLRLAARTRLPHPLGRLGARPPQPTSRTPRTPGLCWLRGAPATIRSTSAPG